MLPLTAAEQAGDGRQHVGGARVLQLVELDRAVLLRGRLIDLREHGVD
jgi:hypothetical protein